MDFGSIMDHSLSLADLSLTQAFSVTFYLSFMALPYPYSYLLVHSFSLFTVYTLCVLQLVFSKSLCARF